MLTRSQSKKQGQPTSNPEGVISQEREGCSFTQVQQKAVDLPREEENLSGISEVQAEETEVGSGNSMKVLESSGASADLKKQLAESLGEQERFLEKGQSDLNVEPVHQVTAH